VRACQTPPLRRGGVIMWADDQRVRALERSYALRVTYPGTPYLDESIKGEAETRRFVRAWIAAEDQGLKLPCREGNAELWFSTSFQERMQACELCKGCPVRVLCLRAALARGEEWGVWGSLDLQGGKRS
jgi:hypothetical protein